MLLKIKKKRVRRYGRDSEPPGHIGLEGGGTGRGKGMAKNAGPSFDHIEAGLQRPN